MRREGPPDLRFSPMLEEDLALSTQTPYKMMTPLYAPCRFVINMYTCINHSHID